MDALRSTDCWAWNIYAAKLKSKGYNVQERRDGKGILRGYVLKNGNAIYKASELGKGRNLMASKIQSAWERLHSSPIINKPTQEAVLKANLCQPIIHPQKEPLSDYTSYRSGTMPYHINHKGENFRYYIPNDAMNIFSNEFDYRFVANNQELTDMTVAIFAELMEGNTVPTSSGGGGGQSDLPWREKDDDDRKWAFDAPMLHAESLVSYQRRTSTIN